MGLKMLEILNNSIAAGRASGMTAIDCSTNPSIPAAKKDTKYYVSVAGKLGEGSGADVDAGDIITYITDVPVAGTWATYGTYVKIVEKNIVAAIASEIITGTDTDKFTTPKAVEDAIVDTGFDSMKTDRINGKTDANKILFGTRAQVFNGVVLEQLGIDTTIGTGGRTVSATNMLEGIIFSDPDGNTAYTLPDGPTLLAAIPSANIGSAIRFTVISNAIAASGQTLTITSPGGTCVLVDCAAGGSYVLTEGTNPVGDFIAVFTDVTTGAYNVYPTRGV